MSTEPDPTLNPMRYIDEPSAQRDRLHATVADAITEAYRVVLDCCPRSAERTLAIRKLQEARMWANAAIVFDGRTYPV